jgi:murein DD-endopeptidase MepM/ murein hydrolase activator NlpD
MTLKVTQRVGSATFATTLLLAVLALWSAGCATAQPAGRRGLLEGASALRQSPEYSHRSNKFSALDRSPAARAVDAESSGFAGASKPESRRARKQRTLVGTMPGQDSRRPAVEIAGSNLRWPVAEVKVTSSFGPRGREFHEGIDLKAPVGTPVYAAQDGTVIYSGSKIRGYGRLVVVRHFKQVSTIYAHNSKLLVRSGQYVRQGQKIAISGQSGHVTGPHVHFEVRDGLSALDPEELLPSARTAMNAAPMVTEVVHTSQAQAQVKPRVRAKPGKRRVAHATVSHSRVSKKQKRAQVVATAPRPSSDEDSD